MITPRNYIGYYYSLNNIYNVDNIEIRLKNAVNELLYRDYKINACSWNSLDKINLNNVPSLLWKFGGIDKLYQDGIIEETEKWEYNTYTKQDIRDLIIKYTNSLN